jgi:hypothetical protein
MARAKSSPSSSQSSATIGFEARLRGIWLAADKLRNKTDAAVPVCHWLVRKNEPAGKGRAVSDLEPALVA